MKKTVNQAAARCAAAVALCAALVCTACPQDADEDNGGTNGLKPPVNTDWLPAATPFILRGETAATNIKLTWQPQPDCIRYEVYRDGVLAGTVPGDVFDDYALVSGQTYRYTVTAYRGTEAVVVSAEANGTPFTPAAGPDWTWKNSTGTRTTYVTRPAGPGGWQFGNVYYDFRTSGSPTINLQGRTSSDGFNWTDWTTLTTDGVTPVTIGTWINPDTGVAHTAAGAKLEGQGWRRIGNKVVTYAHREESGSTYTLGNFLLASFYPGETYPEYAAWPGGAKAEVTFDGQPFGCASRDQSVFIDDDGAAYALTCTTTDTNIFRLDAEWTRPEEHIATVFAGQRRETPHIIRIGEWYYFFGSRQSGWYPSQAQYARSKTLAAEGWSELLDIGNSATFGSQFNRVEEYSGESGKYGMWGYRWAANWVNNSKEAANIQRAVPLTLSGGFAGAKFFSEVAYYADFGLIGVQAGRLVSLGAPVNVSAATPAAGRTNLFAVTDGAEWAGSTRYTSGNVFPYSLIIDLGKFVTLSEITMTTYMMGGSEGAFKYTVDGSTTGLSWTTVVDGANNWRPGFTIDEVTDAAAYRYVRLTVTGVTNVQNNSGIGSWADGITEFAVYGTPR